MTDKITFTVECDTEEVADIVRVAMGMREENAKLRKALLTIVEWADFPDTGKFWDEENTRPMPYSACFGTSGERDHMRRVAAGALGETDIESVISILARKANP